MTGRGEIFEILVLSHDSLVTTDLSLDLLTSPASSLDSSGLEFPVGLGLLNHRTEPVLTERINQLAVGVGVGKITAKVSSRDKHME